MRHAPQGGISVAGDWYEGGQFLPDDDFSRSSRRGCREPCELRPGMRVLLRPDDCARDDWQRTLETDDAGMVPAVITYVSALLVNCRYRYRIANDSSGESHEATVPVLRCDVLPNAEVTGLGRNRSSDD